MLGECVVSSGVNHLGECEDGRHATCEGTSSILLLATCWVFIKDLALGYFDLSFFIELGRIEH